MKGKRHGLGCYFCYEKDIYIGEFKDDVVNGKFCVISPNKLVCTGERSENAKLGKRFNLLPNGDKVFSIH